MRVEYNINSLPVLLFYCRAQLNEFILDIMNSTGVNNKVNKRADVSFCEPLLTTKKSLSCIQCLGNDTSCLVTSQMNVIVPPICNKSYLKTLSIGSRYT